MGESRWHPGTSSWKRANCLVEGGFVQSTLSTTNHRGLRCAALLSPPRNACTLGVLSRSGSTGEQHKCEKLLTHVHTLRAVKSPAEIAVMQKAADIRWCSAKHGAGALLLHVWTCVPCGGPQRTRSFPAHIRARVRAAARPAGPVCSSAAMVDAMQASCAGALALRCVEGAVQCTPRACLLLPGTRDTGDVFPDLPGHLDRRAACTVALAPLKQERGSGCTGLA